MSQHLSLPVHPGDSTRTSAETPSTEGELTQSRQKTPFLFPPPQGSAILFPQLPTRASRAVLPIFLQIKLHWNESQWVGDCLPAPVPGPVPTSQVTRLKSGPREDVPGLSSCCRRPEGRRSHHRTCV